MEHRTTAWRFCLYEKKRLSTYFRSARPSWLQHHLTSFYVPSMQKIEFDGLPNRDKKRANSDLLTHSSEAGLLIKERHEIRFQSIVFAALLLDCLTSMKTFCEHQEPLLQAQGFFGDAYQEHCQKGIILGK